jgi:NAD-dependent dihydropyrimidine dehydrogenase PreA subunit
MNPLALAEFYMPLLMNGDPTISVNIKEIGRQYVNSMLKVHRDICGYCGCCVSVCPEGALELIDAYLSVEKNCTSCGICAKVCPLGALEVVHEKQV